MGQIAILVIQSNDSILTVGVFVLFFFFFYKDTQDVGGRRHGPLMVSPQLTFSSQPKALKPFSQTLQHQLAELIS